jgi:exopolysaccharide/PEP-CTERM locus tyrosine autokinase
VSKIQKAIRDIQKRRASAPPAELQQEPLGKLSRRPSDQPREAVLAQVVGKTTAPPVGDEARELATLDPAEFAAKIHIDKAALVRSGFLAPDDENRLLEDEYRRIKRPLVAHAFGKRATKVKDGHVILVTSALPGDGKTFSCINLALSLARERDLSVILVDGDVAKGHVSRLFGVIDQPGLLDLLEEDGTVSLQETILQTDVERLSIMAAGNMRVHSTELLASDRMERIIRALIAQDPNRLIVFDSPPLLATTESSVITSFAGQIVMVVCANVTPQRAVLEAIDLIDEDKALNLVLNKVQDGHESGYYGYGYGYGYGSDATNQVDEK